MPANLDPSRLVQLKKQADALPWYHSFILSNGERIRGAGFTPTVPLVRNLLSRMSLQGRNCVDLGTMDGLFAIMMEDFGCKEVIAFDRQDKTPQIGIVKELSGSVFPYYSGVGLEDVPRYSLRRWGALADVVNFSGILYHMFDVLRGIGIVRGMVRRGGLVVLETPAVVSKECRLFYNWNWKFYTYGTYFIPTLFCLEELCKFMGFKILDANYITHGEYEGQPAVRVAVTLRAVDIPTFQPDPVRPDWVQTYSIDDFIEVMDYSCLRSTDDAAVAYKPINGQFFGAEAVEGGSLYNFCSTQPPFGVDEDSVFLELNGAPPKH
jgi:hypothetical protein